MGEKCCKGASETFHKEDWQQSLPDQNNLDSITRAGDPAAGICKRLETPHSNFTTSIHPDRVPNKEESKPKSTMTQRIQVWVKWFIELLKKSILKSTDDDADGVHIPAAAGRQLSAHVVRLNEQHFQGCVPPDEESRGRESLNDGNGSECIHSQDVWASIAAEIDQGGIPIDLIKERRDVIVQCVMQTLGNEIQQEKDTNSHMNADDLTTLENIEEANRKLRTIQSSLEKPSSPGINICPDSIQAIEAHRAPVEEITHAKAERFEEDFETSESDNEKLQDILSSLKRSEAVTMDLQKERIEVAGDGDSFCESRDQSQTLATKPKVNAGSNVISVQNPNKYHGGKWRETSKGIVAVQTSTKFKRGSWFRTAGGSLKRTTRTKAQKMLHGKTCDQDWTSHSQFAISNQQVVKAVNAFQVPDDDEDVSGYDAGGSTDGKNDGGADRLEHGKVDEEVLGCIGNGAKIEGKCPTSRCSNEETVKHERNVGKYNGTGNFNPYDVCVALGKGELDERRMKRLKEGFIALLDDAVGGFRRVK